MSKCKYCYEPLDYDTMIYLLDNEYISKLGEKIKEGFYCEFCIEDFELDEENIDE